MAISPPAKQNDVSIIIVTRNTCALTRAAVRSILESQDELAKEVCTSTHNLLLTAALYDGGHV